MAQYYFLATNIWGCGRALEPNNGWGIDAYTDKAQRDKDYHDYNFERTGVIIPSTQDVCDILGCEANDIGYGPELRKGVFEVGIAED